MSNDRIGSRNKKIGGLPRKRGSLSPDKTGKTPRSERPSRSDRKKNRKKNAP